MGIKRAKISPPIPQWELDLNFDPSLVLSDRRMNASWCNYKGEEVQPSPLAPPAEAVARKAGIFDLSYLPLRNPDKFVAGGIHDNFSETQRFGLDPSWGGYWEIC
jgi:hypothetical protein